MKSGSGDFAVTEVTLRNGVPCTWTLGFLAGRPTPSSRPSIRPHSHAEQATWPLPTAPFAYAAQTLPKIPDSARRIPSHLFLVHGLSGHVLCLPQFTLRRVRNPHLPAVHVPTQTGTAGVSGSSLRGQPASRQASGTSRRLPVLRPRPPALHTVVGVGFVTASTAALPRQRGSLRKESVFPSVCPQPPSVSLTFFPKSGAAHEPNLNSS